MVEMQTVNLNWIKEEAENLKKNTPIERLEGLKMPENQITEITIDVSKPFDNWTDPTTSAKKKLIPVTMADGTRKLWWLNCANPLYTEIVRELVSGVTKFRIMRTGQAKGTRYVLVKQ